MIDLIRKPIRGWEGYYEVDNIGNIYSLDRVITVRDGERVYQKHIKGKTTKGSLRSNGYRSAYLSKGDIGCTVYVHRIVAEAFVPNPNGYSIVNHINENKSDNRAENLEWCTQQYNLTYGGARDRWKARVLGRVQGEEEKAHRREVLKEYYKTHKSNTYRKPSPKRKSVIGRKLDEDKWTHYESATEAAKVLGLNSSDVSRVASGVLRKSHGYVFKYEERTNETV